jgi:Tfp pilus assembly protein PilV
MKSPPQTTRLQPDRSAVALVVTTMGLLGLASLQLLSIKTQHNAFMRGQATQINHDMIRTHARQTAPPHWPVRTTSP